MDINAIDEGRTEKVQFNARIEKGVEDAFNYVWAIRQAQTPFRVLHKNELLSELIMEAYYDHEAEDYAKAPPPRPSRKLSFAEIKARAEQEAKK
jgi:hypothetical protein